MVWYLAQLFPRTYWTTYADSKGEHFVIWKMWLGRSYRVNDIVFSPAQTFNVTVNPSDVMLREGDLDGFAKRR